MAYILDICTALPPHSVSSENFMKFYVNAAATDREGSFVQKLRVLSEKTKIHTRYSCIPDFDGPVRELFLLDQSSPSVENRMQVYKEKVIPLAARAVEELMLRNKALATDVTHLMTVSCTGLFAPGMEFLLADHLGLQHTEKCGLYFLGCYAALKALKQAHYITQSDPRSCVLIVCAELCSLHFNSSVSDEDMVANLLFGDGAAAVLVCGASHQLVKNKQVLAIDKIASACIPHTLDLMTWTLTASAFRMYLNKNIVKVIKESIRAIITQFLGSDLSATRHWAVHPGGVRIIEAVQQSLGLEENKVSDSFQVMQNYGNMSSPTILFILSRIFNNLREKEKPLCQKIFSCAFGPGITVEMISYTFIDLTQRVEKYEPSLKQHVAQH